MLAPPPAEVARAWTGASSYRAGGTSSVDAARRSSFSTATTILRSAWTPGSAISTSKIGTVLRVSGMSLDGLCSGSCVLTTTSFRRSPFELSAQVHHSSTPRRYWHAHTLLAGSSGSGRSQSRCTIARQRGEHCQRQAQRSRMSWTSALRLNRRIDIGGSAGNGSETAQ